jgi:hypothetical protein
LDWRHAAGDADLKELARGDIRLNLTRKHDLKLALLDIYRRGRPAGNSPKKASRQSIQVFRNNKPGLHRSRPVSNAGLRVEIAMRDPALGAAQSHNCSFLLFPGYYSDGEG